MKIYHLIITLALLSLGCKESAKADSLPAEESNTEQTNKTIEPANSGLTQNGNYSSLFDRQDCKIITAEEISTTLGITFTEMEPKSQCAFKSQFPDNKTWYLSFILNKMSTNDIQREIQSFKEDETGLLTMQISETGDTYLCNQHSQGYLSIYNPNYNSSVLIRYGSIGESRGFTKEERLEHQALALKLANTLLKNHQK